jgi:hypothetical protein
MTTQFYVLSLLSALLINNISIKKPSEKEDDGEAAVSPAEKQEKGMAVGETARAEGA